MESLKKKGKPPRGLQIRLLRLAKFMFLSCVTLIFNVRGALQLPQGRAAVTSLQGSIFGAALFILRCELAILLSYKVVKISLTLLVDLPSFFLFFEELQHVKKAM